MHTTNTLARRFRITPMTPGTPPELTAISRQDQSNVAVVRSRRYGCMRSRVLVVVVAMTVLFVSDHPSTHGSSLGTAMTYVNAFIPKPPQPLGGSGRAPPNRRRNTHHANHQGGNGGGGGCGGGGDRGGRPPPLKKSWKFFDGGNNRGGGDGEDLTLEQSDPRQTEAMETNVTESSASDIWNVRGGATDGKKGGVILQGGKTVLSQAAQFWSSTVDATTARIKGVFQSKQSKKEQTLLEQLQTMPIRQVSVPNSTVLPPEIIRMAVKRSGLVGNPLRTDRVQEFAKNLKRWYVREGYVLHSVTGATLRPESATAEITVEEPVVSRMPVQIVVCKEMVVDDETGETMTFRQYQKRKQEEQKQRGSSGGRFPRLDVSAIPDRENLNTTLVTTKGRTRASQVAKALRLQPGRPFQWYDDRWRKVASSGVFSKVLRAAPERTSDGGICLQVFAMEPPARHLEYGIGKSIWTNSWEGEVDFDWRNLFGGGESIGVLVRRGTKDAAPSVRVKYGDDKFGLEGGYDVEVFSDFLGDMAKDPSGTDGKDGGDGESSASAVDELDQDSLLSRRGATVRLRNPISAKLVANSVASASVERTSTTTGRQESIGSATLTLGPFRRLLPMDARTSITSTFTGGTRFRGASSSEGAGPAASAPSPTTIGDDIRGGAGGFNIIGTGPSWGGTEFLPYSSASATSRHILPISVGGSPGTDRPPITLAFQHTISASSPNLPRHEARAMANAAQIRGATPDGPTATAVKGTTEVRVPISAPLAGSGTVVLFGDWFYVQPHLTTSSLSLSHRSGTSYYTKSSIGIGLRKTVQGLLLKYDFCYSSEGKFKSMFGLGPDFDA